VTATDDGRGAGHAPEAGVGHGLVGMRERVAMHGGTFDAGPVPGRGWRVSASIPVGGGGA
jgi:signal transduction histidine kinase